MSGQRDSISVGGDLIAKSVAAGRGSRAITYEVAEQRLVEAGLDDVVRQLHLLIELLRNHGGSIADPDVIDSATELAIEVGEPQPRRGVIKALMASILAGAGALADVDGAVAALQEALTNIGLL